MTWITWRRYRVRMIAMALYVVALVVLMILTQHAFENAAVICARVHVDINQGFRCDAAAGAESNASYVQTTIALLPLFIGLVFGTPMVASELERKTNRLAWTQGITRTRWLLGTWLTLAVPTVVVMSLFALVVQWWATHVVSSISSGGGLIQPAQMLISGVAPIALTLLLLTFGMFIGIVVRRFFSPYATSVVAFLVVMGIMSTEVLPSLAPKVVVPTSSYGTIELSNSLRAQPWFIRSSYRWIPGYHVGHHALTVNAAVRYCSIVANWAQYDSIGKGLDGCLAPHGLQSIGLYQPASRYWLLQWREAGVYVELTGVLLGLSIWAIRRWST